MEALRMKDVCIESTMDYNRFKIMTGNRGVLDSNVKRLVASMSNKQLASIAIVNDKDEIVDGQHRYKACEQLGIPFHYIVMKDYGIDEVHILNTNMKNWTNEDFVHQFSDRFIDGEKAFLHYFELVGFMEEHNLKLNNALMLLEDGMKSGSVPLRDGVFTITTEKEQALENLGELIALEKVLGSKAMSQAFWQTYIISKQVQGFNADKFLLKMRRAKDKLDRTPDTFIAYTRLFEEAYNAGRGTDLNLAFSAKAIYKSAKSKSSKSEDN